MVGSECKITSPAGDRSQWFDKVEWKLAILPQGRYLEALSHMAKANEVLVCHEINKYQSHNQILKFLHFYVILFVKFDLFVIPSVPLLERAQPERRQT